MTADLNDPLNLGDPSDYRLQPPCPDCTEFCAPGCYIPGEVPENWRDLPDPQTCDYCSCWGGRDRECENCWLASK